MGGLLCSLFVRFICAQMWGRRVLPTAVPAPLSATLSPALRVYLANVGPQGLVVVRLPAPFVPHSASLGPTTATRVLSAPATGLHPSALQVGMNVYFLFPWCRTSLPFDSLSVLVVRGGAVCLPMLPSWFSTFGILIIMCLGVDLFEFICLGLSLLPGIVCLFLSPN